MSNRSSSAASRLSARSLLPLGFCGVFLLMAAAMVESYRAQSVMAGQPAAMAEYDRADRALQTVLQAFNQSQGLSRDLLLKPELSSTAPSRLQSVEEQMVSGLGELQRSAPAL